VNGAASFIIIDKLQARLCWFSATGPALGVTPLLLAQARGDASMHRVRAGDPAERRCRTLRPSRSKDARSVAAAAGATPASVAVRRPQGSSDSRPQAVHGPGCGFANDRPRLRRQ
jgi:hypothetical protein